MAFVPAILRDLECTDRLSEIYIYINDNFHELNKQATELSGGNIQLAALSSVLLGTETDTAVTPYTLHQKFMEVPSLLPQVPAGIDIGSALAEFQNLYLDGYIEMNGDQLFLAGGMLYINGISLDQFVTSGNFVTLNTIQDIVADKQIIDSRLTLSGVSELHIHTDFISDDLRICAISGDAIIKSNQNMQVIPGGELIIGEGSNTNPISTRTVGRHKRKVNFKPPADATRTTFIDWDIPGAKTIYPTIFESGTSIPILNEVTNIFLPSIYTTLKNHGLEYTFYKVNDTNLCTFAVSGTNDYIGHAVSGAITTLSTSAAFASLTLESMSITSGENYWIIKSIEGDWI